MTNIFADFRRLVLAALDDLAARGRAAAGARFRAGRGRAAARPGAWRSRHQRGDGAGRRGQGKPDGARRADRRGARPAASWRPATTAAAGFTVAAARPGFLNIRLGPKCGTRSCARSCAPARPLAIRRSGGGERVNVEFVSANPTGPMHVGHGRGAVVGDALAALLAKAGFAVASRILHQRRRRAGRHPRPLDSICATARRSARRSGAIPDGLYPGDYLVETGRALAERDGEKWLGRPEAEWLRPVRDFAVEADDGADPRRSRRARRAPRSSSPPSARWSKPGAIDDCLAALEAARADLHRRAGAAQGQAAATIGSRGRRPCSAPPNSATTSTGRSRNRTARGPISPPTSPITATSSAAASPI